MFVSNIKHGEYDITVEGSVLIARLKGSWNEEAAIAFERDFMAAAKPLMHSHWGHLVYLDDWNLAVPEIGPVIERLVGWCIEAGLKRSAQVYSPSMLKRYQLDLMVVEELGDFKRRVFAEDTAAIQWLAEEGFG